MGCCVSTNKASTSQKKHNVGSKSLPLQKASFNESRAPPPSVEEETVKEVLSSETPKLKPQVSFSETLKPKPHFPLPQQDKKNTHYPVFDNKINKAKADDISMSLSEVSEICSVSMSESVSTTTVTDHTRDYEEEVKQKLVSSRSPAKLLTPPRNRVGDRVVGKSPNQSPSRRNGPGSGSGSVRLVHQSRGGEPGQGMVRRGSRPEPNRREPGESSMRRSRSPATNRSVMGRTPSVRRTNRSPGRVRSDPAESSNTNMEVKWPQSNTTTNESLENPLVSLECFIFL